MGVDIISCANVGCATEKSWKNANPSATFASTTSVKRSLFGAVDHDEAMLFFKNEFERVEKHQRTQWNFDFKAEKPLKGPYKWEKIELIRSSSAAATTSPCKLPRSPSKVTKNKSKRSPLKSKTVNRENVENHNNNNNNNNNKNSSNGSRTTKQSSITDYLDKTKSLSKHQRAVNK